MPFFGLDAPENIANKISETSSVTESTEEISGIVNGLEFKIGIGDEVFISDSEQNAYLAVVIGFNHDIVSDGQTRAGKKAGCSGKIYRFFNHPTKLILGFFVVTMCAGAVIFWKSRCISWQETVILQEDKKEPVKDTSIVYISNCFVGSDMTAHTFDSLVEKVNEKKPDVILFGGNLFGKHTKEETVDKTLASIKKMKAALGIYMVEGSADSALVEEKKEKISGAGVHLLLDESAVLHNGLQLIGCRADGKTKKPMSYTLSLINKEKPSIVLAGGAMEEKLKEEKKISLVLYPKKITDTGNGGTSGINQMFPRNVLASAKINFIQIKK